MHTCASLIYNYPFPLPCQPVSQSFFINANYIYLFVLRQYLHWDL